MTAARHGENMTQSLMANILAYERKLKDAGYSEAAAQAQAEATAELMDSMLASTIATRGDIQEVLKSIHQSRQQLETDIKDLEMKLTLRIGAIVLGALGLISYLKTL
jgi:predicted lipoprotein